MRAWAGVTFLAFGVLVHAAGAHAHCYQGDCQAPVFLGQQSPSVVVIQPQIVQPQYQQRFQPTPEMQQQRQFQQQLLFQQRLQGQQQEQFQNFLQMNRAPEQQGGPDYNEPQ